MGQAYGQKPYTSMSQVIGKPTGWYTFRVWDTTVPVYIDMDYDQHPNVLVIQNRQYTQGMKYLDSGHMVSRANYRTGNRSEESNINNKTTLAEFNCFVAPLFWGFFGFRKDSSRIRVTQFVSPTIGTSLDNTSSHTKRYSWSFTNFNTSNWAFNNAAAVTDHTNTGSPGMYNYHAVNEYGLSSTNGCADNYGYHPWWYGSCWSGSYFGSITSHSDRPYWHSSGSDAHNYGAVYIS